MSRPNEQACATRRAPTDGFGAELENALRWRIDPVRTLIATLLLFALTSGAAIAQCGGKERWAVKVAAESAAAQIDTANPIMTTLADLVALTRPVVPADEVTRTPAEGTVRVVEGRLIKFKRESGKTGDQDFHLVISDETLLYSAGGAGSQISPHSVIAEIPDPNCLAGRDGSVTVPSRFQSELVRTQPVTFCNPSPRPYKGPHTRMRGRNC